MPGFRAYLLPLGVVHLIYGLLLFYLFPLPAGTGIRPLAVALASGIVDNIPYTATMIPKVKHIVISREILETKVYEE